MNLIHDLFKPYYDSKGIELINKAYLLAKETLKDEKRDNGKDFIEHPLNVALIVAKEVGLQAECVAAVFLHEASRKMQDIDKLDFSPEIIKIVDGLNKISTIKPKDTRLEAENYKKLIVKYSSDPRVTVIKLADRLEIMRNISIFPKLTRERKILESLLLYIPLAHQLGLYNMKSEMEDIYFRYSHSEEYRLITNKLKATEKDRERLKNEFVEPLKISLSQAGIKYKLKVRTKTAYSIYKKMEKQKVPFEKVYDVFAMRFIIDCENDNKIEKDLCWKVYSYVTQEYEADTKRLRDWISKPKQNGYESLHITVKNKDNSYIEVQIRTKRMDDIAENGHASHWSYKGIKQNSGLDSWLSSVRYKLEHPNHIDTEDEVEEVLNEIFVFTPSGELRILPKDSSVLDFAFDIHSVLGTKCTGAKVNGKAVSIKEKLATGDVVEIMSSKNQKPNSDWINYVVSSKAKVKIRQMLNEAEYKKASTGKEILSRKLKNWKLSLNDELFTELRKKLKYNTINAFYAAIGENNIDVNIVKNYILEEDKRKADNLEALRCAEQKSMESQKEEWKKSTFHCNDDILVLNAKDLKGLDYKMAKCCNPVFGDDVFGFVTRISGIKIHRMSCPNASRLIDNYPYRIQKVKWADNLSTSSFQTKLRIIADMEGSVINETMDIINQYKASLRYFNVNENNRNGTYDIQLKLSVSSNTELDKILSQLRHLKNIIKVNRG